VLGGALVMCVGAALLSTIASSSAAPVAHSYRGVWPPSAPAPLGHDVHPVSQSLSHRNEPAFSFVTFFTFGELGMMSALAVSYLGPRPALASTASAATSSSGSWLGGFIWVIGDLFQQYAAKYVGISRGIPLSQYQSALGTPLGHSSFRPSCTAAAIPSTRK